LTDAASDEEEDFCEYAPVKKNEVSVTEMNIAFRNFMEL
jgi:hypothetical protein